MRGSFSIAVLGCLTLTVSLAPAQLACPPMPDKITQVNRDVRVDVDGSVGSLGKLKAGQLGAKTEVVAKNLFEKYPYTDRLLIAQMMSATYCGLIRDSKSLKEADKLHLWEEFSDRIFRFTNSDYKPVPTLPKSRRKATPELPKKETGELKNAPPEPHGDNSQKTVEHASQLTGVVNERAEVKSESMAGQSEPSTKGNAESKAASNPSTLYEANKDTGEVAAAKPIAESTPPLNTPSGANSSSPQLRTSNEVLAETRGVLAKDRESGNLQGCRAGTSVELRRVGDDISYYVCVQQCFATWQTVSPKNLDFEDVSVTEPHGEPNLAIVKIPCLHAGFCLRYQEGTFPDSAPWCLKSHVKEDVRQSLDMVVHTENVETVLKLWKEFARQEQKP